MLKPGDRIGVYEVGGLLGVGGMGEVYVATDVNLARRVAIKVLSPAVAAVPDLLARFDREARALAALNHANIAAVYGLERSGAGTAIVMELVEGPTLAERIAEGPLPVDEAMSIAAQIAEALEAAHEQGIVHRDLKPGNIKLRDDGTVKVLDFGLAKIMQPRVTPAGSTPSPALTTSDMTEVGTVLGTTAYMSPEQARAQRVDKRTDIWAFGCVLYEMLAGRPAFGGLESADVSAAVLRGEPDWRALPESIPAQLRTLVQDCLKKDRTQRIGDISTARYLLHQARTSTGAPAPSAATARSRWPYALAAAAVAAGVTLAWWGLAQRDASSLVRAALLPPPDTVLDTEAGFALSPDGTRLAFVARDKDGAYRLWVRPLAALEASPLAGTDGAYAPFWSPDGRELGFFADNLLKRVPAAGGAVQVLTDGIVEPKGGAWSPDGRIVYVPNFRTGLFEVSATGGEPREITTLDAAVGELSHRWPQFLPDGQTLLYLVQTAEGGTPDDQSHIVAREPDGELHSLIRVNASAAHATSGHLLFWREGSIYAQPFDSARLRLAGEPRLVAEGVGLTVNEQSEFAVSDTGILVYHDALRFAWQLEWRDRTGRLLSVAARDASYDDYALAPDGRRLAYIESFTTLRLVDLARGTDTRLSFDGLDHVSPAWSRGGDWLAYSANKLTGGSEIYRREPTGAAERELLYSSPSVVRTLAWSADASSIVFAENGDLFTLDVESGDTRIVVDSPGVTRSPSYSPDGRWLAYVSDESGRNEVYLMPAAGGQGKTQVSSTGAIDPEWSPDGKELFFVGIDNSLRVVTVDADGELGVPETLFALTGTDSRRYQLGPNGTILVRTQVAGGNTQRFTFVLDWPELLE